MTAEPSLDISVVIPVKNEAGSVLALAAEVTAAFESTPHDWECLWVDDGSTDGTLDRLRTLHEERPRHEWISLDRNYGQSAALAAGFQHARGRIIGTLDGDGQNDPADLPRLMNDLSEGRADMVNGRRMNREDHLIRRISSRIANSYRTWLTGKTVTDVGCSTRVFSRQCVEKVPVFKGMHRFLPTLVRMQGFRIVECPVNHRPRIQGRTKYGIHNRLWVGIWDTFAVHWMRKRLVEARVARTSRERTEAPSA